MPNWCMNHLTVEAADPAVLDAIVATTRGRPGSLPGTPAPPEQAVTFEATLPLPPDLQTPAEGRAATRWAETHWGTKWDLTPADTWDRLDATALQLEAPTAWTPPLGWVTDLLARYPAARFHLVYFEPGNQLAGELVGDHGAVIAHHVGDAHAWAVVREQFPGWGVDEDAEP